MRFGSILALGACLGLAACATSGPSNGANEAANGAAPFASTYRPAPSTPTLLRGAAIRWAGRRFANTDVLIVDGRISAVGKYRRASRAMSWTQALPPPASSMRTHLGDILALDQATSDGNEMTQPNTAECGPVLVWPQDPGFGAPSRAGSPRCTFCQVRPICLAGAG